MHQIEIEYKGSLRTESVHLKSGQKLITDAPADNKGKGEAFSPTDLTASALGSCMLTIIGILLKGGILILVVFGQRLKRWWELILVVLRELSLIYIFRLNLPSRKNNYLKNQLCHVPSIGVCILILKYWLNFITINNTIIVIIVHKLKKPILLGWAFIVWQWNNCFFALHIKFRIKIYKGVVSYITRNKKWEYQ